MFQTYPPATKCTQDFANGDSFSPPTAGFCFVSGMISPVSRDVGYEVVSGARRAAGRSPVADMNSADAGA